MINVSALAVSPLLFFLSELNAWADEIGYAGEMLDRVATPLPLLIKPIVSMGMGLN